MKYWIFGAGKFGRQCYEIFSNKLDIIGFIDNNKEKNGISYCGKIVLFYSEFLKHFNKEEERIIIANARCSDIYIQLMDDMLGNYVEKVYRPRRLIKFEEYWNKTFNSTCGEELWLKDYFSTYPKSYKGIYVDVGAFHPFYASNTKWAYDVGWRGINIDANIDSIKLFKKFRPEDKNINCGVSDLEGELEFYIYNEADVNTFDKDIFKDVDGLELKEIRKVQVKTLNRILEENNIFHIDLLDIDVEGLDEKIVMSFDWEKYCPQCVLIEILNKNSIEEILDTALHKKITLEGYRLVNYAILTAMYVKIK